MRVAAEEEVVEAGEDVVEVPEPLAEFPPAVPATPRLSPQAVGGAEGATAAVAWVVRSATVAR